MHPRKPTTFGISLVEMLIALVVMSALAASLAYLARVSNFSSGAEEGKETAALLAGAALDDVAGKLTHALLPPAGPGPNSIAGQGCLAETPRPCVDLDIRLRTPALPAQISRYEVRTSCEAIPTEAQDALNGFSWKCNADGGSLCSSGQRPRLTIRLREPVTAAPVDLNTYPGPADRALLGMALCFFGQADNDPTFGEVSILYAVRNTVSSQASASRRTVRRLLWLQKSLESAP